MIPSKDDVTISKKEMLESINRSGYLLESEISELLNESGFFVEANQVIKDPNTGKSREIDLLAELIPSYEERSKVSCAVSINYVFEIKNNPLPMVLISNLKISPNVDAYESLKEIVTETERLKYENLFSLDDSFYERLLGNKTDHIFTQYCSFKRKRDGANKSELMALHPDEFHEGLMKIVQHCDEEMKFWDNRKDDNYFRNFLYLPVIVLGGLLFELTLNKNMKPILKEVKSSNFLYNYHWKDQKRSALIWIVTEKGFSNFMNEMIRVEKSLENDLVAKIKSLKF
jgi:hypothetical protein